ncbi:hypothetical protein KIN20_033539 [Parelaphostrongylus tenuis]|uniref:Uncharacterized protein n=1 Tax=Parelaphostrongylus tenuis TaxID=148309 RepID=A0AAD5R8T3_PARTN|nr:hypothetical protein KIN20_033539 [Parelaphostrongylus tenuis]
MFSSRELNGKKCNVTKLGFPNAETLFKAYPDYFYSQDGLWYGQVTEASKDVVRSMVTEKSKKKRGEQRHSDADRKIEVQVKRLLPEMGSEHGIEDREAPTQFECGQGRQTASTGAIKLQILPARDCQRRRLARLRFRHDDPRGFTHIAEGLEIQSGVRAK